MKVSIFDEGKKGELVGDGVLLLNEVIDKGELDGTIQNKIDYPSALFLLDSFLLPSEE